MSRHVKTETKQTPAAVLWGMKTIPWVEPNEKGHFCPGVRLINNSGHIFTNALRHTESHDTHNAQGGHFSLSEFVIRMSLWTPQRWQK